MEVASLRPACRAEEALFGQEVQETVSFMEFFIRFEVPTNT